MKNLFIKLSKTNKFYRIFFYCLFILFSVSAGFIIRALLLLKTIETFVRITIIIVFILFILFYLISNLVFLILKKHRAVIITGSIALILTIVNILGFYYINKTYGIVDNLSKDKILYTTNLVSLTETEEIKIVGMISNEKDPEGYILPMEYLDKNNHNYEIKSYDDYYLMLDDLYNSTIEAVFLSSNYVISYNSEERFINIKNETKVVDSYSKEMENQDVIEGTNRPITEPFTILLMGVDSMYDGLSKNAAFNGDTLLLVTFNPNTLNATMFGIPRDTYVPIACRDNRENKINSAAAYGSKCMVDTIENLIEIDIDYYMKINFKGLVQLVDALGGIEVDVPVPDFKKEYCVEDSNRKARQICLKPGLQTLNGEEALALTRVRAAFKLVDFKRVQNQQLVLEAMVKKTKTIRNINSFINILDTISKNLDTNMQNDQILNFYNVGKDMLKRTKFSDNEFFNIERTYLTGYDSYFGNNASYAFQYFEESLEEIKEAMFVNLELKKPDIIKTFNFSINEEYETKVIGRVYPNVTRRETLPNFKNKTLDEAATFANEKNLSINIKKVKDNTCINNTIIEQKISGVILSSINSFTVDVCENYHQSTIDDDNEDTEVIDDIIEDILN